jgi:hypothetical protein
MPAKVKSVSPEVVLARVLEGLEPDLVNATDEDITQAAQDLGMDLSMKGSAAFLGLKSPFRLRVSEIFDLSGLDPAQLEALRRVYEEQVESARKERRAKGASLPREPKDPDET